MKSSRIAIRLAAALALVSVFAGCTRHEENPQSDVQASIAANETAKGHLEWESSDDHPDVMFEKWRTENRKPDEVCEALKAVTDEKLTLFEEQLKSPENKTITAPCREQLLERIKAYWKANTTGAIEIDNKVHFNDVVETRDVSQGYFAVTADLPSKEVALTFDDGPHAEYTDSILATLEAANVHATFFEMGRSIRANPEKTKHVAAHGHSIGSHSITHRCLAFKKICAKNSGNKGHMLTFAEATAEITGAHQMIYDILGWVDPFFRFPYGESSIELKKYLMNAGVGEFYWSVDSNDWRAQAPQKVIDGVMAQLKVRDHGIILMHDIQHRTAIMLPSLLKELYFNGYQPVLLRPADPKARFNSKLVKLKGNPNPGEHHDDLPVPPVPQPTSVETKS